MFLQENVPKISRNTTTNVHINFGGFKYQLTPLH